MAEWCDPGTGAGRRTFTPSHESRGGDSPAQWSGAVFPVVVTVAEGSDSLVGRLRNQHSPWACAGCSSTPRQQQTFVF